jgi:putative transposase
VLLRLAYLGVTNVFALLRLLPASDREKDVEILVLRHQITVLKRQLGTNRPRFSPRRPGIPGRPAAPAPTRRAQPVPAADPAGHGAALAPEPAGAPPRGQIAAEAPRPAPYRPLHPCAGTAPGTREPMLGYRRIHGELLVLGIKVAASTVWEILRDAGIDPAPGRTSTSWASFLRSQAGALLACDFFGTVTVTGVHLFVLAAIEHATRRIRVLGATAHPAAAWVVQAARNLVMDLEDAGRRARFLIRDCDGKFPGLFDGVIKDAGIEIVLSGSRCRE